MEVYKEILPLQVYLNKQKSVNKKVGLVPTMGALHAGHLALIRASQEENDITVCSIFVNPTQFNNVADLEKYPRTQEEDIAILNDSGCDVVFCPENHVMYESFPKIKLSFEGLDGTLEGSFRPGHFNGVGIVVTKLFNIVAPDHAYFGQKDLQQLAIIKQLVKDFSFNIRLRCVPIVREADGLAMSSRNKRLSPEGRTKASILYRALGEAKKLLAQGREVPEVRKEIIEFLKGTGVELEYLEVVDPDTFEVFKNDIKQKMVAVCVAGYLEEIRLIDNVIFKLDFDFLD